MPNNMSRIFPINNNKIPEKFIVGTISQKKDLSVSSYFCPKCPNMNLNRPKGCLANQIGFMAYKVYSIVPDTLILTLPKIK